MLQDSTNIFQFLAGCSKLRRPTIITKCCNIYYKMRKLFQNVVEHVVYSYVNVHQQYNHLKRMEALIQKEKAKQTKSRGFKLERGC